MSKTKIQWADYVWNPVTGCTKVSAGCTNCYAETMAKRLQAMGQRNYANGFEVICHPHMLDRPLRWKKPRRVFVCSMGDLFHDDVPYGFISSVIGVMAARSRHIFLVLTKRPKRMRRWFEWIAQSEQGPELHCRREWWADHGEEPLPETFIHGWPLPNVWLGVTAENQAMADERIPILLQIPAVTRFVSLEPMLGPIDLRSIPANLPGGHDYFNALTGQHMDPNWGVMEDPLLPSLDWAIIGGESGPRARSMDLSWARDIVDQCKRASTPIFVKQLGSAWGRDHADISQWPSDLQVRQFP